MNAKTLEILEFPTIKKQLVDAALSNLGKELAENLVPQTRRSAIENMLRETTEAKKLLEAAGTPPMHGLADLRPLVEKIRVGGVLEPEDLLRIADFLRGCRRTKQFVLKYEAIAPMLAGYARGLTACPILEEKINISVENNSVTDEASPVLRKLRKEIKHLQEKIKNKLQQIVLSPQVKSALQDFVISVKNGRHVLMVKASEKHKIPGIVHGSSGSGNTLFLEPKIIHELSNNLRSLESAEQEEVFRVLSELTEEVSQYLKEIETNLEIMAQYDFAFAKARLSRDMKATEPKINEQNFINLIGARHPLLSGTPVPLDFYLGGKIRTLVITGPNTGGKTVTLKTIGVLTLMAQAGLHVPAEPGTEIGVFRHVFADIGDGQNITQSLSTFSSHLSNIKSILAQCGPHTLVLLDEIGTGTDPAEGSALAIAILEFIYEHGAITVATTHYPEIKNYALRAEGFINGSMAFNRETLQPLYRLLMGKPGESNALWIAEKLGIPGKVLKKAWTYLKQDKVNFKDVSKEQETKPETTESLTNKILPHTRDVKDNSHTQIVEKGNKVPVKVGDLVEIPYMGEKGVVCTSPDRKGRIRVMIKGKKTDISLKRVRLLIPAENLYPEDYDLNTIFLSKEDRKLKRLMSKHHQPGTVRIVSPEEVEEPGEQ